MRIEIHLSHAVEYSNASILVLFGIYGVFAVFMDEDIFSEKSC